MKPRRPKGLGALFQHNGRWYAQISQTRNGKRSRITGTGSTPAEAQKRLYKRLQARQTGLLASPRTPTLTDYAHAWYDTLTVSETVARKYRRDLELHILPALGDTPLKNLTGGMLIKHFDKLTHDGLGVGGRKNAYKTLRILLNRAVALGDIPISPLNVVKEPRLTTEYEDESIHALRVVQTKEILKYLHLTLNAPVGYIPSDKSLYTRIMLDLLGLRQSEKLGLCWNDLHLDDENPYLQIHQQLARHETATGGGFYIKPLTKTKRGRTVPLIGKWLDALKDYRNEWFSASRTKEWNPQEKYQNLLFLRFPTGALITPAHDTEDWNNLFPAVQQRLDSITAMNAQGSRKTLWKPEQMTQFTMTPFRQHYLRHITVSLLREAGVPISTVVSLLGHTDAVDWIYTHSTANAKTQGIIALSKSLKLTEKIPDKTETSPGTL